jgi:hypothetical protein
MPLLGSNINSEFFMANPIANTGSVKYTEPVYIIKGEKDSPLTDKSTIIKDGKKFSVNLEEFKLSLQELSNVYNTLIQQLSKHHAKIFINIIQSISLAKNSPPVHYSLLAIIEKYFPQNLNFEVGSVASYFTKTNKAECQPDNVTSVFNNQELTYRVIMFDSSTNELYYLTDTESNKDLAYIYVPKKDIEYKNLITQLKFNGILYVRFFSNYDNITKTFGTITETINLEEYENTHSHSKNNTSHSKNTHSHSKNTHSHSKDTHSHSKDTHSHSKDTHSHSEDNTSKNNNSSSSLNNNSANNNSVNNNSGLVFFIILLIIIVLALAIIYKNNY